MLCTDRQLTTLSLTLDSRQLELKLDCSWSQLLLGRVKVSTFCNADFDYHKTFLRSWNENSSNNFLVGLVKEYIIEGEG